MPVCVISTVGTSVFSNGTDSIKDQWKAFSRQTDVDLQKIIRSDRFDGLELYQGAIEHLRAETRLSTAESGIRKSGAELNSLSRILQSTERSRSDLAAFLATATPDGVLAARVIRDFASEYFQLSNCSIRLVDGLQVRDGRAFQRDGVRNLIGAIYDILKEAPHGTYHRIINPTGGFKAVVPYLTLIGMIEPDIELSYIYEQSDQLIRLGRIPLQFDFDAMESAEGAILACNDDFVPEAQMKRILQLGSDAELSEHASWSFFDEIDQNGKHYMLNGLGMIFYRHLQLRPKVKIYLSKQASAKYDSMDQSQLVVLNRILDQMRNPDWVRNNLHATGSDKMKILKPSDNLRPMFYHESDDKIVVADILLHSDKSYEKVSEQIDRLTRANYPAFRLWEKQRQ
jgi:putative CRISPR-associated protein (TIGR02619 family)